MKLVSASLMSLALMSLPAAQVQAQPKPGDALTIHAVPSPKPPAESNDDDDPALKLKRCGEKWNRKLAAYEKGLPKLKKYLAYYNKWDGYPAQRPPKSPVPLLTRESYRACLYECLGDTTVVCPGGWPAETDKN